MARTLMHWTGARLLLAISGVCAILAVVSMALLVRADYEATIAEAEDHHGVLAQLLEEHARRALDLSKAALHEISGSVMADGKFQVGPATAARMQQWVAEVPQISAFWLLDETGTVVFTTAKLDPAGFNFADRPYFRAHLAGEELYVGELTLGRIEPNWFFSLSQRLTDPAGRFRGVLMASMRADFFGNFYARLGLAPEDNVGIYKPDGRTVVRRLHNWRGDTAPSLQSSPLFTAALRVSPIGVYHSVSPIDGIERIVAYRTMDGWPLVVSSGAYRPAVLAPWRVRACRNATYCLAGLVLLATLTTWGYCLLRKEELAQAKNAVLLNEVHHRVKNNLAIIQSLLSLEAARVPAEARKGYQDSIARVEAMGLVHHLLYDHQSFAGINAAEYLRHLCDGLEATTCTVRIDTNLQAVEVDLDTAMPMALIATEMLNNAIKHAFPPDQTGTVLVRLRRDGNQAVLTIHDDGAGLPDGVVLERAPGLGLTLVRHLTRQLNGTATLESLNGTLFTLVFPLAGPN